MRPQTCVVREWVAIGLAICLCMATARFAIGQSMSREVLDQAKKATVLVLSVQRELLRSYVCSGSGFFVSPRGHVITNQHVVGDATTVRVVIESGTAAQRIGEADVIKRDREADLALLRTDLVPDGWLVLADAKDPTETERVWALGFPLGLRFAHGKQGPAISITAGTITSLRRGRSGQVDRVQTDAAISQGNSGGPLIDATGAVIGVAVTRMVGRDVSGMAFGIPSRTLKRFLEGVPLKAEDAYAAAVTYYAEHPADFSRAALKFELVLKGWPASRWARTARTKLAEV